VIDAAELSFMDHRNLLVLAGYARSANATVVLRTTWPGASRMIELLDVKDVRVESPE
jgi:hypothetical protein